MGSVSDRTATLQQQQNNTIYFAKLNKSLSISKCSSKADCQKKYILTIAGAPF